MAKRSVTDEVHIAALAAAIELVKNPEYSRDWLKTEFAEREINSVRVTNDILDAVEVTMVNQLDQIAAMLKLQLEELIKRADAVDDDDESPTMKLVNSILEHDQDPDDTLQPETAEVKPKRDDEDIEIVDFIGLAHDERKVAPSVGGYPVGSKIARAEQAAKTANAQEATFTAAQLEVIKNLDAIKAEELARGHEVSTSEAMDILRKRLTVGFRETD